MNKVKFSSKLLNIILFTIILLQLVFATSRASESLYEVVNMKLYIEAFAADQREEYVDALMYYKAFFYREPSELDDIKFKRKLEERMEDLEITLKNRSYIINFVLPEIIKDLKKCNRYPCYGEQISYSVDKLVGNEFRYRLELDSPFAPPNSVIICKDKKFTGACRISTLGENENIYEIKDLGNFKGEITSIVMGDDVWIKLFYGTNFTPPSKTISINYKRVIAALHNLTFDNSSVKVNDNVRSLIIYRK